MFKGVYRKYTPSSREHKSAKNCEYLVASGMYRGQMFFWMGYKTPIHKALNSPNASWTDSRQPPIEALHSLLRIVPSLVRVRPVHQKRHGRWVQSEDPGLFHAIQNLFERFLGRFLRTFQK